MDAALADAAAHRYPALTAVRATVPEQEEFVRKHVPLEDLKVQLGLDGRSLYEPALLS